MNSEKNITKNLIFEACVGDLSEALKAENKGAHRIELCFDLKNAGLTPPENWIIESKKLFGFCQIIAYIKALKKIVVQTLFNAVAVISCLIYRHCVNPL